MSPSDRRRLPAGPAAQQSTAVATDLSGPWVTCQAPTCRPPTVGDDSQPTTTQRRRRAPKPSTPCRTRAPDSGSRDRTSAPRGVDNPSGLACAPRPTTKPRCSRPLLRRIARRSPRPRARPATYAYYGADSPQPPPTTPAPPASSRPTTKAAPCGSAPTRPTAEAHRPDRRRVRPRPCRRVVAPAQHDPWTA